MASPKKHLVSVYVQNVPGVSIRLAMVFARRGYNIESFVGSETERPDFSRINIVATGDSKVLQLIIDQLNRLVNVIEAREIEAEDTISRELALFKVTVDPQTRSEVVLIARAAGCEIIEIKSGYMSIQCVGPSQTVDAAVRIFADLGIREIMRTGKVFLSR